MPYLIIIILLIASDDFLTKKVWIYCFFRSNWNKSKLYLLVWQTLWQKAWAQQIWEPQAFLGWCKMVLRVTEPRESSEFCRHKTTLSDICRERALEHEKIIPTFYHQNFQEHFVGVYRFLRVPKRYWVLTVCLRPVDFTIYSNTDFMFYTHVYTHLYSLD